MERLDLSALVREKEEEADDVSTLEEEFLKMVANLETQSVAMEEEGPFSRTFFCSFDLERWSCGVRLLFLPPPLPRPSSPSSQKIAEIPKLTNSLFQQP